MQQWPEMVISTINSEGKPESAVVGFGFTKDFELIMGTPAGTRKARNLQSNPHIAAIIGWDKRGTMQYEGIARSMRPEEIETYTEIYFQKNPQARHYHDDPEERYFLITPTWLRYSDVARYPWDITELKF